MKISSEWLLTLLSIIMFFMATHNFFTVQFSIILASIAFMIIIMAWVVKLDSTGETK